jgi:hypothetical protein
MAEKIPEIAVQNGHSRPRRINVEKYLLELASQSGGYTTDFGLWNYANTRVRPGDIEVRNRDEAIRGKIADLINHALWSAELDYDGYLEGEAGATERFERYMRTIKMGVGCWLEHSRVAA